MTTALLILLALIVGYRAGYEWSRMGHIDMVAVMIAQGDIEYLGKLKMRGEKILRYQERHDARRSRNP